MQEKYEIEYLKEDLKEVIRELRGIRVDLEFRISCINEIEIKLNKIRKRTFDLKDEK